MSERRIDRVLGRHEQALQGAFYRDGAAAHQQHLALELEEREARTRIAEATGITDTEVLAELAGLGIRVDTLAALTLLPLVEVAWCDGELADRERDAVLDAAVETGIERDSTSYRLLELWLVERPPPDLANAWKSFVGCLRQQLTSVEVDRMRQKLLGRARDVAAAAGDRLNRKPHVSSVEQDCLAQLEIPFRG